MAVKSIKASTGGGEFEQIPAGVYLARCYKMVDIGTQQTSGKFPKKVRQVMLYWELLQDDDGKAVFMEDGERVFSISNTYTKSMNSKASLRKDLDSWRGIPFTEEEAEDFDITKLLDKFCMLQVVHNKSGDKVYANVGTIMTTKKTAKGVNELVGFTVDDPDMGDFAKFPQWLQDKIKSSEEWSDDNKEIDPESTPSADTSNEKEDDKIDIKDVPF